MAGITHDNAPEYVSQDSWDFCDEAALQRLMACRYRPQQDGVAEATWRVYDPRCRAAIGHAMAGRIEYLMLCSVYLCNYVGNRLASSALPSFVAPLTVLAGGKVQSIRHARVLGCQMSAYIPQQTRGPKGRRGHNRGTARRKGKRKRGPVALPAGRILTGCSDDGAVRLRRLAPGNIPG